jgi:hypothetical protein
MDKDILHACFQAHQTRQYTPIHSWHRLKRGDAGNPLPASANTLPYCVAVVQGPGHNDTTLVERALNVLTCAPFLAVGLRGLRWDTGPCPTPPLTCSSSSSSGSTEATQKQRPAAGPSCWGGIGCSCTHTQQCTQHESRLRGSSGQLPQLQRMCTTAAAPGGPAHCRHRHTRPASRSQGAVVTQPKQLCCLSLHQAAAPCATPVGSCPSPTHCPTSHNQTWDQPLCTPCCMPHPPVVPKQVPVRAPGQVLCRLLPGSGRSGLRLPRCLGAPAVAAAQV